MDFVTVYDGNTLIHDMRLRYIAPLLARCIYCGYATRSRTNDQPVCVACDKRILNRETLTLHNGI